MSSGPLKRTRADRVASVVLPPGHLARTWGYLRRGDVLVRVAMCLAASVAMWAATKAWAPPFTYRTGNIPARNLIARATFKIADRDATENQRNQRRTETIWYYQNQPQEIVQLRAALKDKVFLILGVESYQAMDEKQLEAWREFFPKELKQEMQDEEKVFDDFRATLTADPMLAEFDQAIQRALAGVERDGLLDTLQHDLKEGNQLFLLVHPVGDEKVAHQVDYRSVQLSQAVSQLEGRLQAEFRSAKYPEAQIGPMAKLVFQWLKPPRLRSTLSRNEAASRRAIEEAEAKVETVYREYKAGETKLADGKVPLAPKDVDLLRIEHDAIASATSAAQKLGYNVAVFGMYFAMYMLCGSYLFFQEDRVLRDLKRFSTLLITGTLTVAVASVFSRDDWRAEIIPLILFGITITIAYQREMGLLLSAALSIIITFSLGQGLPQFVILVAGVASAVLLLGRIRSRTKLIYVGLFAGVVTLLTTMGVGTLAGQPFGSTVNFSGSPTDELDRLLKESFLASLFFGSLRYGFFAFVAGVLMTGLLPFIEKMFDVQTDISLLELGDAAHPLLQELARRAPGTYNHSINVASIGEAAAEAIGANGLLVRVGAYFHDIGKMLKPNYFVENQGHDANRHENLLPAMSTLVIIAHVKDGADLARQHRLPQSIIDFIEQHHGTTLVEYFFHQATKRSEDDPDGGEVDESSFRYPGPKPQTKESGVMMLADAVESASRTLVEPTPARIENLVHELAMKRLLDGQFDECGLTLCEVHEIEDSLVKSLTAVYHGRVKYPERQQSA